MPTVNTMTATIWVSRLAHWRLREFAFLIEVLAHVVEFLDDGLNPLTEFVAVK